LVQKFFTRSFRSLSLSRLDNKEILLLSITCQVWSARHMYYSASMLSGLSNN